MVVDYTKKSTASEPQKEKELKYAGFWIRVAASLLDGVIIQIAFFIIALVMGVGIVVSDISQMDLESIDNGVIERGYLEEDQDYTEYEDISQEDIILFTLIFVMSALYYIILNASARFKATFGKYVLEMQVLDLQGNKISYMRSFWRYFFSILSGLISIFTFGLPYWLVALNQKKRSLHDYLAGTIVIIKS